MPGERIPISAFDNKIIKIKDTQFKIDPESKQIIAKTGGVFTSKQKKDKIHLSLLSFSNKFYPEREDYVIGIIKSKNNDFYTLDINAPLEASLNLLDFEGASKRNRPNLEPGALVYCRIVENNKYLR